MTPNPGSRADDLIVKGPAEKEAEKPKLKFPKQTFRASGVKYEFALHTLTGMTRRHGIPVFLGYGTATVAQKPKKKKTNVRNKST